jgi:Transposase, Mutator family
MGSRTPRRSADILICCVDGLKGFPEAIEAIFPKTTVQTCVDEQSSGDLSVGLPLRSEASDLIVDGVT